MYNINVFDEYTNTTSNYILKKKLHLIMIAFGLCLSVLQLSYLIVLYFNYWMSCFRIKCNDNINRSFTDNDDIVDSIQHRSQKP